MRTVRKNPAASSRKAEIAGGAGVVVIAGQALVERFERALTRTAVADSEAARAVEGAADLAVAAQQPELLLDGTCGVEVRRPEGAGASVVVDRVRGDEGTGVLFELEHLVTADAAGGDNPLARGSEDRLGAVVEDRQLPVEVGDVEVLCRDVRSEGRVGGLNVDPPVSVQRIEAGVVGKLLRDRDQGAASQVGPQRVVAQRQHLLRLAGQAGLVGQNQFPTPDVQVVLGDHQLEPVAAVSDEPAPVDVAAVILEHLVRIDGVVFVENQRDECRVVGGGRCDRGEDAPVGLPVGEAAVRGVRGQDAVVRVVHDPAGCIVQTDRSSEGVQLERRVQRTLARLVVGPDDQEAATAQLGPEWDLPQVRLGVEAGQEHPAELDRPGVRVEQLDPRMIIALLVGIDRGVQRQDLVDEDAGVRTDAAGHAVGCAGGTARRGTRGPVGDPSVVAGEIDQLERRSVAVGTDGPRRVVGVVDTGHRVALPVPQPDGLPTVVQRSAVLGRDELPGAVLDTKGRIVTRHDQVALGQDHRAGGKRQRHAVQPVARQVHCLGRRGVVQFDELVNRPAQRVVHDLADDHRR